LAYYWVTGAIAAYLAAISNVYLVLSLGQRSDGPSLCMQSRTALIAVLALASSLVAMSSVYTAGTVLPGLIGWLLVVLVFVVIVPFRLTALLRTKGPSAALTSIPLRVFVLPIGKVVGRIAKAVAGRASVSLEDTCARELGILFSPDPVRVLRSEPLAFVVREFGRTTAEDIMVPRSAVVAVPSSGTLAECVDVFVAEGFSRLPVYEGDLESVTGIVHVMDLLRESDLSKTVKQVTRPVLMVPQSKTCDELLKEFQRSQSYMAMVLDEYGGVAGLVTIEDVLEELVGDMGDEPASLRRLIRRVSEGTFSVQAQVEVEKLESATGIRVPNGDYETLAGFLLEAFGRIPETGAEIEREGVHYEVALADERRIKLVKITRRAGHSTAESTA
jgi:magnesium and cobalt transporter